MVCSVTQVRDERRNDGRGEDGVAKHRSIHTTTTRTSEGRRHNKNKFVYYSHERKTLQTKHMYHGISHIGCF